MTDALNLSAVYVAVCDGCQKCDIRQTSNDLGITYSKSYFRDKLKEDGWVFRRDKDKQKTMVYCGKCAKGRKRGL